MFLTFCSSQCLSSEIVQLVVGFLETLLFLSVFIFEVLFFLHVEYNKYFPMIYKVYYIRFTYQVAFSPNRSYRFSLDINQSWSLGFFNINKWCLLPILIFIYT